MSPRPENKITVEIQIGRQRPKTLTNTKSHDENNRTSNSHMRYQSSINPIFSFSSLCHFVQHFICNYFPQVFSSLIIHLLHISTIQSPNIHTYRYTPLSTFLISLLLNSWLLIINSLIRVLNLCHVILLFNLSYF